MCDCVGERFLHTQGSTYKNTHVRTTWQCKYRVLAIQFEFWKKNSVYCVYAACLHSSFRKRAKPLASYRETIQSGNFIKCPKNAPDTYISSISFLLQVSSPNKLNIPVGFNHAPNPLTWRGDSRANVPCFNIFHCPLSARKMFGIRYTKANMTV